MTVAHIIRALLDGAKSIVLRGAKMNGVIIIQITRTMVFINPCVGPIIFIKMNHFILLLSINITISLVT